MAEAGECGREQPGDLGPEPRRDLGRPGKQEVAGHDRHEVAPAGVHALDAAAPGRFVHYVVVVERGQVHELNRDASEQGVCRDVAALQVGGRDRQRGSQPFPARLDEMARHLVQEPVVTEDGLPQANLEPSEVALANREREGVRAAHQVRHLRPRETRPTSLPPPQRTCAL